MRTGIGGGEGKGVGWREGEVRLKKGGERVGDGEVEREEDIGGGRGKRRGGGEAIDIWFQGG